MDKEPRARRQHPQHRIDGLPVDVRKELDERIARRDFKSYRELKRWLGQHDCQIATVVVRRHALKLDARLEAVRLATEQARAVVEATGGARWMRAATDNTWRRRRCSATARAFGR